jgi:hypothetical protein
MIMRNLIICVALVCWSSIASADSCAAYAKSRYEAIRTAVIFKDSKVGYGVETPKEVHEFRCILRLPNADTVFTQLLNESTPSGKLYALSGLFISNRPRFESTVVGYLQDNTEVKTMFGCFVAPTTFTDIVKQIQKEGLAQRLASDVHGS